MFTCPHLNSEVLNLYVPFLTFSREGEPRPSPFSLENFVGPWLFKILELLLPGIFNRKYLENEWRMATETRLLERHLGPFGIQSPKCVRQRLLEQFSKEWGAASLPQRQEKGDLSGNLLQEGGETKKRSSTQICGRCKFFTLVQLIQQNCVCNA